MVSYEWYPAMLPLFNKDIALVPPAKLLAGGGHGMTAAEGDAQMAKAALRCKTKKVPLLQKDDALSAAPSDKEYLDARDLDDSESYDSEEEAMRIVGVCEDVDEERKPRNLKRIYATLRASAPALRIGTKMTGERGTSPRRPTPSSRQHVLA